MGASIHRSESLKAKIQLTILRIIVYAILIFLTLLCLFSFYMLIINATRSNGELQGGFTLIPSTHFFENLKNAWTDSSINIPRGMLNSFIVATLTAVLTTYFSALTAYGIHAYDFKLKKLAFGFIMAIMVIPSQVSASGFVQICYKFGLINSYIPLILPGIAAPVVFFYMKQYMDSTLSLSLIEAARIDGAGEFRIFNTIAFPLMKPAIAVQAIFTFVASWNNYFVPALVLHSEKKKTLPILIAQLRSADFLKFDMGQVYVTIAFSIFPVIVVYLCLSRFIVGGVALGSVKG